MPDYYVSLVKEYLELQGFTVRTETKYRISRKDSQGIRRTSWGDIDILAIKIKDNRIDELVVGEVKASPQNQKGIRIINRRKFENKYVKRKVKELFGATKYKKSLFCWSWDDPEREFAMKLGIIPVSLDEIVDYMLEKIKEHEGWLYLRDFPNLMLLQFLQERGRLE